VIDPHSETWRDVEAWARKEIESLRDRLELDQAPIMAAEDRGAIHALRELLALTASEPPINTEPPVDYGV
jgi:hypothetical protein